MPLTRDAILAAKDLQTEVVPVPEWGGDVIVRAMSGAERVEYETANFNAKFARRQVRLVAFTVVDEQGNRLFTEEDVEALEQKNGDALVRVFIVAQRLCGLSPESVKDAEKN